MFIDTTSAGFALAFKDGESYREVRDCSARQTDRIFGAMEGADIPALDFIAVMSGPGSFTGIRLGLAIAKGFRLASGVPVAAIGNFHGVFLSAGHGGKIAIPAGRGEFFESTLDDGGDEVSEGRIVAESDGFCVPLAPRKILEAIERRGVPTDAPIVPSYIRPHYAKTSCENARIRLK
jgi:tRNA threonylcarbamoyl adenosine modification protein YeaZ